MKKLISRLPVLIPAILLSIMFLSTTLLSKGSKAAPAPAFTAQQLAVLPGANWPTNGGSLYNQRYSPLRQINVDNVKNLKGVWRARLNGSGVGPPYSGEAQPLVYDGVVYIVTGADDVFAIDVESGQHRWVYQSRLDPGITTVCCGWTSRGLGLGDGKIFLGRLDGKLVALDQTTGKEVWSIQAERWQEGYTITSAPLYFDGMVITGFAGAEFATRGRVKAYSATDGKLLWTFYTVPGPGEVGHDTWPSDNEVWKYGGATVWQTPAVDPELGLLYFSTGNPGPDFNGAVRKGDNLFTSSIVAIEAKTGKYRWHFQQVHHDLWDYDAPSPVLLFDIELNGRVRNALVEVGKTGWAYILDRTTGRPLIGIEEKPVPQDPRQATSPTQPFPIGDAVVPQSIDIAPYGFELVNQGRIFTPFWDEPVVIKPNQLGGTNWPPSSYHPELGYLFVCSNDRMGVFSARDETTEPTPGTSYTGGRFGRIDIPPSGIFAALDMRSNKLVWRQRWSDLCYSGSAATAGNVVFTGRNDGRFVALDARDGKVLWEFQTGAGVNAPASVFEHKGQQYVAVYSAGNLFAGSPPGDSVWLFALSGTLGPAPAPGGIGPQQISMDGADKQAGSRVFAQFCSQCHGENGKGGHGGGPDLSAVTEVRTVISTVTEGKKTMPSFRNALTHDQIRDVVQFVTTGM